MGPPDELVRQWLPGLPARQLLLADRFPVVIDHLCRLASDLLDRHLQVFGPQTQAGLSSEAGVLRDHVHLGVVEERVLVQVGGAQR
jgi:hypothetical protein